tara:strand:+ start:212 stop:610 length:399 start_codon:yes stop_codon:yes gene_type:complete
VILYRIGSTCPKNEIPPSAWASSSLALDYFIDRCDENLIMRGGRIFIITLPYPSLDKIGQYFHIRRRIVPEEAILPFGFDFDRGWWSFNFCYTGLFKVLADLDELKIGLDQIQNLDNHYLDEDLWLTSSENT